MVSKKLGTIVKVRDTITGEIKWMTLSDYNAYEYINYEKLKVCTVTNN